MSVPVLPETLCFFQLVLSKYWVTFSPFSHIKIQVSVTFLVFWCHVSILCWTLLITIRTFWLNKRIFFHTRFYIHMFWDFKSWYHFLQDSAQVRWNILLILLDLFHVSMKCIQWRSLFKALANGRLFFILMKMLSIKCKGDNFDLFFLTHFPPAAEVKLTWLPGLAKLGWTKAKPPVPPLTACFYCYFLLLSRLKQTLTGHSLAKLRTSGSELGKLDARGLGLKSQPLLGSIWRSSGVRPPWGPSQGFCVPLPPSGLQTNITVLVLATEFWSSAWASILYSSSQLEWLHIYEQTTAATPTPLQPSSKKWGHSLFLSTKGLKCSHGRDQQASDP